MEWIVCTKPSENPEVVMQTLDAQHVFREHRGAVGVRCTLNLSLFSSLSDFFYVSMSMSCYIPNEALCDILCCLQLQAADLSWSKFTLLKVPWDADMNSSWHIISNLPASTHM